MNKNEVELKDITPEQIEMRVRLTLIDEMLGTVPSDPEIYDNYIRSKAPEGIDTADEMASLAKYHQMKEEEKAQRIANGEEVEDEDESKAPTIFHRDPETGDPVIVSNMIKGFFKSACGFLRYVEGTESSKLKAYKKMIDGLVALKERMIKINVNGEMGICQRPLRTSGPSGERVALAKSETIPAGSTMEFTIILLKKSLKKNVIEWLNYGQVNALGQWRNSGKGRFTWEEITDNE